MRLLGTWVRAFGDWQTFCKKMICTFSRSGDGTASPLHTPRPLHRKHPAEPWGDDDIGQWVGHWHWSLQPQGASYVLEHKTSEPHVWTIQNSYLICPWNHIKLLKLQCLKNVKRNNHVRLISFFFSNACRAGSSQQACADHAALEASSPVLNEWKPVQASASNSAFWVGGNFSWRRFKARAGVISPWRSVRNVPPDMKCEVDADRKTKHSPMCFALKDSISSWSRKESGTQMPNGPGVPSENVLVTIVTLFRVSEMKSVREIRCPCCLSPQDAQPRQHKSHLMLSLLVIPAPKQ